MFELLAVEPFVVDPNAMAAAVTSAFTFGRVALIFGLVAIGLGLFFKDQLAAAWENAKANAASAKAQPTIPQALSVPTAEDASFIGLPLDDLSQGFAYARGMDEIYERQGVPLAERKRRLMAAVDSVCLVEVVPTGAVSVENLPPVAVTSTMTAAKGGAA
jgi:hypothetical protein